MKDFEAINNLDKIAVFLEPDSEVDDMLTDALEGKFAMGAARHVQRRILARYQAQKHIEKAIALLNSETPESSQ